MMTYKDLAFFSPPKICQRGFALPDTWATRRGAMIVLRGLHRCDGWPLVTYEHLAQALGDADRRNVHNFWAEFETCGGNLAAFSPSAFPRRAAPSHTCCRSCCSSRWLPEGCYRKRRDKIAFENTIRIR